MSRRPRDRWRDQARHEPTRTDASGPDMWDDGTCPHRVDDKARRGSGQVRDKGRSR